MKSSYLSTCCPFCFVHLDSQQHSLQCVEVKSKITIEDKYEEILKEDMPSDTSKTILRISKFREDIINSSQVPIYPSFPVFITKPKYLTQ